ncbi:MAG: methyltransferase domain-containing protein [Chthoniobacterales bacterium]
MMPSGPPDFDRRATQYNAHATLQREAADWLAEWLPEEIPAPALELGAGTGLFTRHLAARTRGLAACDIAPRMVQIGRRTLPEVAWSVADAIHPPGSPGYRSIFSCSLMQWMPDPCATFRAWHRLAAPGASLISGWFIRGTLAEFYDVCPDAAPFRWRTGDEWIGLLGETGWRIVRCETRTFARRHASAATMLREMHRAGSVVPRRLGAGQLRSVLRRYDETNRENDGVQTTFAFLRVEAVRS